MKKLLQKIMELKKNKRGFTLLETLVAVFILTLALTGPIYIATLAIRSSVESRDNISAYFLAEEAVEYIRNLRDEYSLKGQGRPEILDPCSSPLGDRGECTLTVSAQGDYTITPCEGDCPPLNFNPQNNITYGENTDTAPYTPSKFTRDITIGLGAISDEDAVRVRVRWVDKGRERSFEIISRLFKQEYSKYYSRESEI